MASSQAVRQEAAAKGLYRPDAEHDACGVGFVANIKGHVSHKIIEDALLILHNLDHRGAVGADPLCGDGAGILIQIPDAFYREGWQRVGFSRSGRPLRGNRRLCCQQGPVYSKGP